jgi:hypothetical protein
VIHFACHVCHAEMQAPDDAAGKTDACPDCGRRLQVPPPVRNRTLPARHEPPDTRSDSAVASGKTAAGRRAALGVVAFAVPALLAAALVMGAFLARKPNSPAAAGPGGPVTEPAAHHVDGPGERLTRDERAAWEKVRRDRGRPGYNVAGFLLSWGRWRMACQIWGKPPGNYWTDSTGTTIADYRPLNEELLAAKELETECQGRIGRRSAEIEIRVGGAGIPVVMRQQGDAPEARRNRIDAAVNADPEIIRLRGELHAIHARADDAARNPPPVERAIDRAEAAAAFLCKDPDVKAAVVIDLYSRRDPAVVAWLADDGRGAKKYASPPSPEAEPALTGYLLGMQRRANLLSRLAPGGMLLSEADATRGLEDLQKVLGDPPGN